MYTAKIVEKKIESGSLKLNVNYSNSVENFNVVYSIRNQDELDTAIRSKLEELNKLVTIENSITLGDYTPPPIEVLEPTPEPEPTPEQAKVAEYQRKREELKVIKENVNLGIVPQEEFDTALAAVLVLTSK